MGEFNRIYNVYKHANDHSAVVAALEDKRISIGLHCGNKGKYSLVDEDKVNGLYLLVCSVGLYPGS